MRTRSLALICALCFACGPNADEADPGAAAEPEAAAPAVVPLPEGTGLELWFEGGQEALSAIRDEMRTPALRALFPETMGDVLEQLAPLPDRLKERIAADARIVGIRIEDDTVVAARVRLDANALGPDIALPAGAPHGSRWVMGQPAEGRAALALSEDVLLLASSVEALEQTLPYLVQEANRARGTAAGGQGGDDPDTRPGLHVRAPAGAFARQMRNRIDTAMDERTGSALSGIRRERAQHRDAPALGDPEALIRAVQRGMRERVALLPDLELIDLHFGASDTGLAIRIEADVEAGSPGEEALRGAPEISLAGLRALPEGVGFGATLPAASAEHTDDGWLATLSALAGERLSEADRTVIAALRQAGADAGGAWTIGIGSAREGAWGVAASEARMAIGALDPFLRVEYVRTAAGLMLGCPDDRATLVGRAPLAETDGLLAHTTRLCARPAPPSPTLHVVQNDRGAIFAITQDLRSTPHPMPGALDAALRAEGRPPRGTLASQTDARRIFAELPTRGLGAWVIVPGQLGGALGFFATPATRALGEVLTLDSTPAPTFVTAERIEREGQPLRVRLDLRFAPGGVDQLGQAFVMFSRLF